MDDESLRYLVAKSNAGDRLDAWLVARLDASRMRVRRLLESGSVWVDGRRVAARGKGMKLTAGALVEVLAESVKEQIVAEASAPLDVLAQGDGWVVVNKPAGMPVHPLAIGEAGTVLNAVVGRWPGVQGVGEGGLRSGVVHRLDVDTSGVLAVALTQPVWERLRAAFTDRRAVKVYQAIVLGSPPTQGEAMMDLRVAQHRPARVRAAVSAEMELPEHGSRRCDLRWQVIEPLSGAALIEVELGTGFLHQIRVMMSELSHPLAGDALYQRPDVPDATGATRPMLHASSLRIDEIHATVPDPPDMVALIDRLRSKT